MFHLIPPALMALLSGINAEKGEKIKKEFFKLSRNAMLSGRGIDYVIERLEAANNEDLCITIVDRKELDELDKKKR